MHRSSLMRAHLNLESLDNKTEPRGANHIDRSGTTPTALTSECVSSIHPQEHITNP
ncbi:hypothetical protein [Dermatophilus congolensis]|uniref:hypothetical protein n=1 Tax=Dermatophilus congolensis TaxID=1863 RepID=UPI001469C328|nr:hypothetical protein [Dermatophilus congolensis]